MTLSIKFLFLLKGWEGLLQKTLQGLAVKNPGRNKIVCLSQSVLPANIENV
jgi:hypothetical protein